MTRTQPSRIVHRWPALALVLAIVAGCHDDGGALGDPTVHQRVGAGGGTVVSADGAFTLTVPAGALASDSEIVITEVSVANQPPAVQAIAADKVYRLEPAGLTFGAPVTASLDLPASAPGQVALMLVHSGGSWEAAGAQKLSAAAQGSALSGQLSHFSDLAVKRLDMSSSFDVQPRELKVGQTLVAGAAVAKSAELDEIDIEVHSLFGSGFQQSHSSDMVFVPPSRTDGSSNLPPFVEARYSRQSTFECLRPHRGSVTMDWELEFTTLFALVLRSVATIRVSEEIGYLCEAPTAPPPPEAVRTGVFPMPLGMTGPDGLNVIPGPFAALPAGTHHALVAGSNGALAIDLKTGIVTFDMSAAGPDGQLGAAPLLGAKPVSQPAPGPASPAALFGFGATGSALRSYVRFNDGSYGWSQTLLLGRILDVATAGGGIVSEELLAVFDVGLVPYRWDGTAYRFSGTGGANGSQFDGTLVSAAIPLAEAGSNALVLAAGSGGGTTSTLYLHSRTTPDAPATKLIEAPGAQARRLSCSRPTPGAHGPLYQCAFTDATGKVTLFAYDPAAPDQALNVQTLEVGAGATGVQFGERANGNLWAVVANFDDGTVNVIDFDPAGDLLGNASVPVPEGCVNPPHAAPVSAGGKDYIVATCFGSDSYAVFENEYRY